MKTEEFYKLSREERAVLVAKDVIDQIRIGKYQPMNGDYVQILSNFPLEGEIKEKFSDIKCKVCALGATLMSCTHLGNRLRFDEIKMSGDSFRLSEEHPSVTNLLSHVFTPHTLLLIENAFEGYPGSLDDKFNYKRDMQIDEDFSIRRYGHLLGETLSREECVKCRAFYRSFIIENNEGDDFDDDEWSDDSERRMIAIMENIIANKGEFIL